MGYSVEQYAADIVNSTASARVRSLIEDVHDNMRIPKETFAEVGSVLDENTAKLPLIIRKAMAEKQKLLTVPPAMWRGQKFAGGYTYRDRALINSNVLPEFATEAEMMEGASHGFGIYSMFGHVSPDYPRILKLGIIGLRDNIQARMQDATLNEDSRNFLCAAEIALDGLEGFARRHSEWLLAEAERETDVSRAEDLRGAAQALAHSPLHPASTLREAMQTTWLVHVALQLVGNHLAIGRPDQFLFPYLRADLENGTLTLEQAQELFDLFMLKFNERSTANDTHAQMIDLAQEQEKLERRWRERTIYDIGQQRYNIRDELDATIHWLQNIVIGGVKPEDGGDASNLATSMLLESFRRLRMTNPVVSVRLHKHTPQWLYRQTAVTLKTGGGLPALYNDDKLMEAYESFGFQEKDVRDYANDGCWEIILPGRTDFYFNKINALKCLEWTLNRGRCHIDGRQEVPDVGDPETFETFETLYGKLFENFRVVLAAAAERCGRLNLYRSTIAPTPLLSVLMDGPVENAADMTDHGAHFVVGGTIAEGLSHLIDSLVAIDELVYKRKKYTMRQIVDALDTNFRSDPYIRVAMDRCPKYGTNHPVADAMGRRLIEDYSRMHRELQPKDGKMVFMPGVGTFSWYIAVGEGTGASADGRAEAAPVASNFSPSAGALTKGITAAILSFGNMGLDKLPLGSPLDIGMAEQYVKGEEGTERLIGLMKSFQDVGGNMLTISVADVQTLIAAQENPEAYRDLRVRMGGWSAYFTMLSKEQQDHHIRKSRGGFF